MDGGDSSHAGWCETAIVIGDMVGWDYVVRVGNVQYLDTVI